MKEKFFMETMKVIKKISRVTALLLLTLGLANCGKSDSGGGGGAAPTTTYQMVNNLCYSNVNGSLTQVDLSHCSVTNGTITYVLQNNICYQVQNNVYTPLPNTSQCTSNTGNYQYFNSTCYQNNNGVLTPVDASYCANTGSSQVCQGYHFDSVRWWQCGIEVNCSGYTLMNQYGQVVRCQ